MDAARVFLLSPARLDGVRGRRILEGVGSADCARRLAAGEAVPLCDVYVHISSLYFRGKLAYARAFGRPSRKVPEDGGGDPARVITPVRGLLPADHPVTLPELRAFADEDIGRENPRYVAALRDSARRVASGLSREDEVVLLGSIATAKYLEPLADVFGHRLRFPAAFVGRGDMSRGGLLLRAAEAGLELDYVPALDAERTGARPPRLPGR